MVNVSQSNGLATIFLRYNPDKYKVVKGYHMETEGERLSHLSNPKGVATFAQSANFKWIEYLQKQIPTEFLQVMHLYFDKYVKGQDKMETILYNM